MKFNLEISGRPTGGNFSRIFQLVDQETDLDLFFSLNNTDYQEYQFHIYGAEVHEYTEQFTELLNLYIIAVLQEDVAKVEWLSEWSTDQNICALDISGESITFSGSSTLVDSEGARIIWMVKYAIQKYNETQVPSNRINEADWIEVIGTTIQMKKHLNAVNGMTITLGTYELLSILDSNQTLFESHDFVILTETESLFKAEIVAQVGDTYAYAETGNTEPIGIFDSTGIDTLVLDKSKVYDIRVKRYLHKLNVVGTFSTAFRSFSPSFSELIPGVTALEKSTHSIEDVFSTDDGKIVYQQATALADGDYQETVEQEMDLLCLFDLTFPFGLETHIIVNYDTGLINLNRDAKTTSTQYFHTEWDTVTLNGTALKVKNDAEGGTIDLTPSGAVSGISPSLSADDVIRFINSDGSVYAEATVTGAPIHNGSDLLLSVSPGLDPLSSDTNYRNKHIDKRNKTLIVTLVNSFLIGGQLQYGGSRVTQYLASPNNKTLIPKVTVENPVSPELEAVIIEGRDYAREGALTPVPRHLFAMFILNSAPKEKIRILHREQTTLMVDGVVMDVFLLELNGAPAYGVRNIYGITFTPHTFAGISVIEAEEISSRIQLTAGIISSGENPLAKGFIKETNPIGNITPGNIRFVSRTRDILELYVDYADQSNPQFVCKLSTFEGEILTDFPEKIIIIFNSVKTTLLVQTSELANNDIVYLEDSILPVIVENSEYTVTFENFPGETIVAFRSVIYIPKVSIHGEELTLEDIPITSTDENSDFVFAVIEDPALLGEIQEKVDRVEITTQADTLTLEEIDLNVKKNKENIKEVNTNTQPRE